MSEQPNPTPEQQDIVSEQRNSSPIQTDAPAEKLKLLGKGLGVGLLVIFALIGIKSMLGEEKPTPPAATWQQPNNGSILGLPGPNGIPSSSQQDTATLPTNTKVELVGEPSPPPVETPRTAPRTTPKPEATTITPPVTQPTPVAPTAPVTQPAPTVIEPAPVAEAPPPKTNEGKLEIVLQTAENGIPLPADVYVQLPNGTNVSKAASTPNAKFNLKTGTYRVTARADGRASVSRTISVPNDAVVSEIFALPVANNAANTPPAPPIGMPPTTINPVPAQPAPHNPPPTTATPRESGKLRLVAVDADNGNPLPVNFTISRLDGSTVDTIRNISVAELTLPTEEFVVRFNYQGREGYKSLTVQPGQTHTHTFNIQIAPPARATPTSPPPNTPAPRPDHKAVPPNPAMPELPPPAMGMDELLKRMQ